MAACRFCKQSHPNAGSRAGDFLAVPAAAGNFGRPWLAVVASEKPGQNFQAPGGTGGANRKKNAAKSAGGFRGNESGATGGKIKPGSASRFAQKPPPGHWWRPRNFPGPVQSSLEAQIALARRAISPGSIDGAIGSQTRAALAAFQRREKLLETGRLDTNTRPLLTLDAPLLTNYIVTTNDLARLQPLGKTWLAKSQQSALDYETISNWSRKRRIRIRC